MKAFVLRSYGSPEVTALLGLRDVGRLEPGQKVLVNHLSWRRRSNT